MSKTGLDAYERYRVRKHRLVRFVADALEQSGAYVLNEPSPTEAPFLFRVYAPWGEEIELLCYPFFANKYMQRGRPRDEHRFQIKYGSDFSRYHRIWISEGPKRVTLMFGVHFDEGIIVAVDPAMHELTWFSSSVEFKDLQVREVQRLGWFGWERERAEGRRKRVKPLQNYQSEVLLGFRPEYFLRYVEFERLGCRLDPGERLLLVDRLTPRRDEVAEGKVHPLELELGLSAGEILDLIENAFRLKVAVRGGAAEEHLRRYLDGVPDLDAVQLDKDGMPDFQVVYRGNGPFLIECKNVLRRRPKGETRVDFQKTRAAKGDPCSRYYSPSDFEVLAACLHPVSESWDFRFRATRSMAPHAQCRGRLDHRVMIQPDWSPRIEPVLRGELGLYVGE